MFLKTYCPVQNNTSWSPVCGHSPKSHGLSVSTRQNTIVVGITNNHARNTSKSLFDCCNQNFLFSLQKCRSDKNWIQIFVLITFVMTLSLPYLTFLSCRLRWFTSSSQNMLTCNAININKRYITYFITPFFILYTHKFIRCTYDDDDWSTYKLQESLLLLVTFITNFTGWSLLVFWKIVSTSPIFFVWIKYRGSRSSSSSSNHPITLNIISIIYVHVKV